MEGKRIEGVLLDTAIARDKASEAYETAKALQIKILSRVPESLLAILSDAGSKIKAQVRETGKGKIVLMLENGYELEAQNRLSIPVKEGDELVLSLERQTPPILRVERVVSKLKGMGEILRRVLPVFTPPADTELKSFLSNSGLVYEKKVWDYLRGVRDLRELTSDNKYKVLKALSGIDILPLRSVMKELREYDGKDTLNLLSNLGRIEEKLLNRKSSISTELNRIASFVEQIVRGFVKSLLSNKKIASLGFSIREETLTSMARNPKALDILQEALRDIELNRFEKFRNDLALLGLNIEEPEHLPVFKEPLIASLRDSLKGAKLLLSREFSIGEFRELQDKVKELRESLKEVEESLDKLREVSGQAKEYLSKLEAINYLQNFLIAQGGKGFLVPFSLDEGKGIIAFSKREAFRVFIKLNFEEGFLGVVVEAPRKENPDSLSVVFKTNIPQLERMLSLSVGTLKRELESLGLKVKDIKVLSSEEKEFEEEVIESFGEDSGFNMRV